MVVGFGAELRMLTARQRGIELLLVRAMEGVDTGQLPLITLLGTAFQQWIIEMRNAANKGHRCFEVDITPFRGFEEYITDFARLLGVNHLMTGTKMNFYWAD